MIGGYASRVVFALRHEDAPSFPIVQQAQVQTLQMLTASHLGRDMFKESIVAALHLARPLNLTIRVDDLPCPADAVSPADSDPSTAEPSLSS
jgi:hypothetical protein